jgi:hypothetical protein
LYEEALLYKGKFVQERASAKARFVYQSEYTKGEVCRRKRLNKGQSLYEKALINKANGR